MSSQLQTAGSSEQLVQAATVAEVRAAGGKVVHVKGHTIALFAHDEQIYAVDNRCPHMGFPLHRGTVCDRVAATDEAQGFHEGPGDAN